MADGIIKEKSASGLASTGEEAEGQAVWLGLGIKGNSIFSGKF